MEGTLAEIRMFAGNFPPSGWSFCNGSLQSIAQNTALFALLGTTYGGDGQQTFGLPDLRGRLPVGVGNGSGLPPVILSEFGGVFVITLAVSNLPPHNHSVQVNNNINGMSVTADGNYLNSKTESAESVSVAGLSSSVILNSATIGNSGTGQPFEIYQPYLGMNYIICMEGIFPSRN